ncbi:MED6 mediator sub complex component-domain-containing protein [Hyaloraphidium curvatum]|nr:MED6 mediator sub complex component-domain-containing protein [Hyaloraphidium curvatum]
MDADNPLHVAWADTGWFEAGGTLDTPADALAYFARSRFYDRRSNNEVANMQTRATGRLPAGGLLAMVGMEFDVDAAGSFPPRLWIVRKQWRESPAKVSLRAIFYILDSTIYMAPDVHTLLSSRLLTSLHQVTVAFDRVRASAAFDPADCKFRWKDPAAPERDPAADEEERTDPELAVRMDRAISRLVG